MPNSDDSPPSSFPCDSTTPTIAEVRYGESSGAIIDRPRRAILENFMFIIESQSDATLYVPRDQLRSFLVHPVGDRSIQLVREMLLDRQTAQILQDAEREAAQVTESLEAHGDPSAQLAEFAQRLLRHTQELLTRGARILQFPADVRQQAVLNLEEICQSWVRDVLKAFGLETTQIPQDAERKAAQLRDVLKAFGLEP